LAKQKGHIRILKALREIKFPFNYTIIGDGPEKHNIFSYINNFHLHEYVTHIPFTKDVQNYLSNSDVFLQGSYVEGFPNALIESCAVGTPVVAYKAPGGIDEIIINGKNGFIAADHNDFVEKINLLANRINELSPSKVRNVVYSKYDSSKIIKEYEDLFIEILDNENA
jgi:glycosyltransferase involved in cell wall biosynthesis